MLFLVLPLVNEFISSFPRQLVKTVVFRETAVEFSHSSPAIGCPESVPALNGKRRAPVKPSGEQGVQKKSSGISTHEAYNPT